MQPVKLLRRIVRGEVDNVDFLRAPSVAEGPGILTRWAAGAPRVFALPGMTELVNLQEEKGQAKRYQVRQVADVIRRYDLKLEERQ